MLVQPQRGVQGGDQRPPLLPLGAGAVGERGGRDDGEPAGDLPAPGAGEQPGGLHVDARVGERGRQPLGEVFQLVRHLGPGAGGQVEVVQLIHADQLHPGAGSGDADRVERCR